MAVKLIATLSCDEYIPSFLAGNLNIPQEFENQKTAHMTAKRWLDDFTTWVITDPSCDGAPVDYTSRVSYNPGAGSEYSCIVNDVIFKINVYE